MSRPCLEVCLASSYDFRRGWDNSKVVGGGEKLLISELSESKQWLSLCSWALHLVPAQGPLCFCHSHTVMSIHRQDL